jgi:hypothetical protein
MRTRQASKFAVEVVPEAAVDEDDLPSCRETQVWLPRQVFAVKAIADPAPWARRRTIISPLLPLQKLDLLQG